MAVSGLGRERGPWRRPCRGRCRRLSCSVRHAARVVAGFGWVAVVDGAQPALCPSSPHRVAGFASRGAGDCAAFLAAPSVPLGFAAFRARVAGAWRRRFRRRHRVSLSDQLLPPIAVRVSGSSAAFRPPLEIGDLRGRHLQPLWPDGQHTPRSDTRSWRSTPARHAAPELSSLEPIRDGRSGNRRRTGTRAALRRSCLPAWAARDCRDRSTGIDSREC